PASSRVPSKPLVETRSEHATTDDDAASATRTRASTPRSLTSAGLCSPDRDCPLVRGTQRCFVSVHSHVYEKMPCVSEYGPAIVTRWGLGVRFAPMKSSNHRAGSSSSGVVTVDGHTSVLVPSTNV